MSLLNDIVGGLAGQSLSSRQPAGANPVMQMAAQLISSSGGLGALLQKFSTAGLGSAANAWVAQGPNPPLSADQLVSAVGQEQVNELAHQHGMPPQQAAQGLAQILPSIVDKLTPDGALNENHSGSALESALSGLMKGGAGGFGLGDLAKLFGQ